MASTDTTGGSPGDKWSPYCWIMMRRPLLVPSDMTSEEGGSTPPYCQMWIEIQVPCMVSTVILGACYSLMGMKVPALYSTFTDTTAGGRGIGAPCYSLATVEM